MHREYKQVYILTNQIRILNIRNVFIYLNADIITFHIVKICIKYNQKRFY